MPRCYVVISTNPRSHSDVQEIADQLSSAVGEDPGSATLYFDDIRKKAHVFVPLDSDARVVDLFTSLKEISGIIDFTVVGDD